jgi:endo-1,4-beta-D-glucanase Y
MCVMLMTSVTAWATSGNYSTWLETKVPDNKIKSVADILYTYTHMGLKEAKDLAKTSPCYVWEKVTLDEAKALAKALNDAGLKAKVIDLTTDEEYIEIIGAYSGPTLPATEAEMNYSGAYYTGDYPSPFKTYLGKTDEEIQAKLDQLWNHYFKGDNNSKVYFETNDGAYIEDINNSDVRSEGMSYGMMICVQTNHKEKFDKLWNFAKSHMWHNPSTGGDGYFSWSVNTNGSVKDQGCVPDAEIYFMMSLLFAANRWNDESYMKDAQAILKACWKDNSNSLFNEQYHIVTFQPTIGNNSWTDPSYSLSAFVDLFARWSDTYNVKWTKATSATRDHLYKSSNTKSGLFSDYNNFDGTPHPVDFNHNSTKYMYDAMRCAMNFGMDYYLFGADAARQTEMAKRIIDFFEADGYTHARFDWDGKNPSENYTTGEKGCNAVACYALMGLPEYEEAIKKNLKMAWDEKLMTGQYRYYDGLVHYLSMLHLCGAFKIWKGQLAPPTAKTELVYTGAKQDLVVGGRGVEENLINYFVDGTSCGSVIPQGTDAKEYTVKWYASSTKYTSLNTPEFSLTVTILPKTVTAPTITLSQTSYDYDGTAKTPTVTVKDGETVIPASEYTVGYENNTKVGTATVTVTDKTGGNYAVSGSIEFEIKTAEGSLTAPEAKTGLVYNGGKQDLITAGSSATGTIQYSLDGTNYATAIPQGQDVNEYTVYYKVVAKEGYKDVAPATVKVVISPKTVSAPTITLSQTSYDFDGSPKTPTVTVKDGETVIPASEYAVSYSNNTAVGTATVTITDKDGGNYTINGSTTFKIVVKGDANGDKVVNVADIVRLVNDKAPQADIDAVVKIILQE